jgi:hypothetical protein
MELEGKALSLEPQNSSLVEQMDVLEFGTHASKPLLLV